MTLTVGRLVLRTGRDLRDYDATMRRFCHTTVHHLGPLTWRTFTPVRPGETPTVRDA
jgi:hypothetical protein